MTRKSSLIRSALIALPLGLLSVGVGYYAFHFFNRDDIPSTGKPAQTESQALNQKSWPEVQRLISSGIEPLSEADLEACRSSLGLVEEQQAPAHSDNFGDRDAKDLLGREIPHQPALIVLHETVISAPATINFFQTPHPNDNDQASYHMLVSQNGDLIRFVPDENRAYGAGYSRFGDFTVHSKSPNNFSVNNVALHISLETPPDGRGDVASHSGYTRDQYNTLAKQVLLWQAKYGIPMFRVTTHASVDRSHSRYDPRTFRWDSFDVYHRKHAATCGLVNLTLT
ncbi:N-acetylmuramoyl-L-alanine amidase [Synechococcus sp. CB0205]|uniref:N-acetylmuramoyl-L-alanine amidase n=1 Tax=Synechococcus sp. CB0205 TaxID=232363 RepID=UPI0012E9BA0A|nr:peptidoglycan recognition family protein [Synechococcus sp. CB0205]